MLNPNLPKNIILNLNKLFPFIGILCFTFFLACKSEVEHKLVEKDADEQMIDIANKAAVYNNKIVDLFDNYKLAFDEFFNAFDDHDKQQVDSCFSILTSLADRSYDFCDFLEAFEGDETFQIASKTFFFDMKNILKSELIKKMMDCLSDIENRNIPNPDSLNYFINEIEKDYSLSLNEFKKVQTKFANKYLLVLE